MTKSDRLILIEEIAKRHKERSTLGLDSVDSFQDERGGEINLKSFDIEEEQTPDSDVTDYILKHQKRMMNLQRDRDEENELIFESLLHS